MSWECDWLRRGGRGREWRHDSNAAEIQDVNYLALRQNEETFAIGREMSIRNGFRKDLLIELSVSGQIVDEEAAEPLVYCEQIAWGVCAEDTADHAGPQPAILQ